MQSIDIYQIDAFTHELFKGNPAAVCVLDEWFSDDVMQNIAQENNLSETAFIVKVGDNYQIRWMAPKGEVDLCGHATLAAACAITEFIDPERKEVLFLNGSRELIVQKMRNEWKLKFPRFDLEPYDLKNLDAPLLALSPQEAYWGNETLVLVLSSQDKLIRAAPDLQYLKEAGTFLSLTAVADQGKEYDFVSRFFAPSVGIDEDPVTGSVHCLLAPLWKQKLGKNKLKARQLSKRGGHLTLRVEDDHVYISGGATPYMSGKLILKS